MINDIIHADFDIFRFTVVAVTGFINLRLLYNISQPLTMIRKVLVYSCFIIFYLLLVIFNKFFLVSNINFLSVILEKIFLISS